MVETVGAAATVASINGFAFQVFDGCIKGFVLLSGARNLDRDADVLRCRLDWEHFRLEQWAEKTNINEPRRADLLVKWVPVTQTLEHIRNITTDSEMLKEHYNLILVDDQPSGYDEIQASTEEEPETVHANRFERLFVSNGTCVSTAVAKVMQSKTSIVKRLRWEAVDKIGMEKLIGDIGLLVSQLRFMLNLTIQMEMSTNIVLLLQEAVCRCSNVLDLEYLRELVGELKGPRALSATYGYADQLEQQIERKLANLLHIAIKDDDVKSATELLHKGISANVDDHVGCSALINAAERGHVPMIELLLGQGADPLRGTSGSRLPLHIAAENGHFKTVRLMLERPGVNVNAPDHHGQTPIFTAADKGHTAVVKLLLKQPEIEPNPLSSDGFSLLLQAVFGQHAEIVSLLLARKDIDPNKPDKGNNQTPLWVAVSHKDCKIVHLLLNRHIQHKDVDLDAPSKLGETALGRCARRGYATAAKLLIAAGVDINKPNKKGRSPISVAAGEGHEDVLAELLYCEEHIEFEDINIDVDSVDNKKRTALHYACEADQGNCVRILFGSMVGLNLSMSDQDGNTPLHLAAKQGNKIPAKRILRFIREITIDDEIEFFNNVINAENNEGNTPLALAATGGKDLKYEAVVRLLIEGGADPTIEDENLETAFEKAQDRRLDGIVSIFKEVSKKRARYR